MKRVDDANEESTGNAPSNGLPQCRICLDGPDQELGRLIRPCLCKGSISVCVRTDCHQSQAVYPLSALPPLSTSMSSVYRSGGLLPPLGTHSGYALSATTATISPGLECLGWPPIQASFLQPYIQWILPYVDHGPAVVAAVSAVIFTLVVYVSSLVTAACLDLFEQGVSEDSYIFSYYFYPIDTFKDLVSSTLSILNDEFGIIEQPDGLHRRFQHRPTPLIAKPDSLVVRLVKKLLLGLPLVGVGSLVHMILSMPVLGPVQWIARYRSSRGRRGSSRDMTAIIIVGLMLIGALRFIYQSLNLQLCSHAQFFLSCFLIGLSLRFTISPRSSPNDCSFGRKTSSSKSVKTGSGHPASRSDIRFYCSNPHRRPVYRSAPEVPLKCSVLDISSRSLRESYSCPMSPYTITPHAHLTHCERVTAESG